MNVFKSIKRGLNELTSLPELSCNKECPKYETCQCTLGGKTCEYPTYRDPVNVRKNETFTDNYLNSQDNTPLSCSADQNKPECSLVEELREVQRDLNELSIHDIEIKLNNIWDYIFGKGQYEYLNFGENMPGIMTEYIKYSKRYMITSTVLDITISKLIEYKKLIEQYDLYTEEKNKLKQRESELKTQLGIK